MPTVTSDSRARLTTLLRERALVRESVVLSSGRRSSYYFDARQVLLDPEGAALSGELMWAALAPSGPRAVGGLTLGADPLVCAVSATAWAAGERVTGFFVRKEAKKHGLGKQIEGAFAPGQAIALVEDTMTTGGSTLEALDAVTAAGGKVTRVLCIVDRGEGAAEAFAARGLTLEALFTRKDLPV